MTNPQNTPPPDHLGEFLRGIAPAADNSQWATGVPIDLGPSLAACVVDLSGEIVAGDDAISAWRKRLGPSDGKTRLASLLDAASAFDDSLFPSLLNQQAAFAAKVDLARILVDQSDRNVDIWLVMRRLNGSSDLAALASFHRAAAPRDERRRDPLTGLPDRSALLSELRLALVSLPIKKEPFAILFLDLDDFKRVNDQCGHAAGDAVLVALARRWSDAVRNEDLVARYGGDEFAVLLPGIADPAQAQPVIDRLRSATASPIACGSAVVAVSATIGVAIAADATASAETLLAEADRDMYARKNARL